MESLVLNPIYNVMMITLIIFSGLMIYVYRLDKKLSLLENAIKNKV
ncbi:MAG: CcmD family protein [Chloroherpetonaceae bacterium]|nr:CcmD family protein [Chloroherpetonaceae bacterium]